MKKMYFVNHGFTIDTPETEKQALFRRLGALNRNSFKKAFPTYTPQNWFYADECADSKAENIYEWTKGVAARELFKSEELQNKLSEYETYIQA